MGMVVSVLCPVAAYDGYSKMSPIAQVARIQRRRSGKKVEDVLALVGLAGWASGRRRRSPAASNSASPAACVLAAGVAVG